jgi:hypothetical protein
MSFFKGLRKKKDKFLGELPIRLFYFIGRVAWPAVEFPVHLRWRNGARIRDKSTTLLSNTNMCRIFSIDPVLDNSSVFERSQ